MQPGALDLLQALSAVLDRWGRWYLFGAQAVVAYGAPRFSADVDVTVELDPDDPERFVRDMEAGGFALRVDDPDFVRRTRVAGSSRALGCRPRRNEAKFFTDWAIANCSGWVSPSPARLCTTWRH